MANVTESVDVGVPISTAYNQWTQFEQFPRFMEGVERVEQLTDDRLHWVAEIGGKRAEWYAKITEQHPDDRVAWTAEAGKGMSGVVSFNQVDADRTRVTAQIEWQPEGVMEEVGAALGFDDRQVKEDLDRFRDLMESNQVETGGWRGDIDNGSSSTMR
jgi:uncharacterized membrane protein